MNTSCFYPSFHSILTTMSCRLRKIDPQRDAAARTKDETATIKGWEKWVLVRCLPILVIPISTAFRTSLFQGPCCFDLLATESGCRLQLRQEEISLSTAVTKETSRGEQLEALLSFLETRGSKQSKSLCTYGTLDFRRERKFKVAETAKRRSLKLAGSRCRWIWKEQIENLRF
jgi:hypothetical protein